MDIFEVRITKFAKKELRYLPTFVIEKLQYWIESIQTDGLRQTKKIPGFHDEPVKGKIRGGQRSIRLSKAYRAFYKIENEGKTLLIEIIEVNKHVY